MINFWFQVFNLRVRLHFFLLRLHFELQPFNPTSHFTLTLIYGIHKMFVRVFSYFYPIFLTGFSGSTVAGQRTGSTRHPVSCAHMSTLSAGPDTRLIRLKICRRFFKFLAERRTQFSVHYVIPSLSSASVMHLLTRSRGQDPTPFFPRTNLHSTVDKGGRGGEEQSTKMVHLLIHASPCYAY